jgi:competence protein CoiA
MKFALIDGNRTEAIKGAKGICPSCGSELIAKCGESKINHWAHKKIRNCDSWWEPETQWHRGWKEHFPLEWQELVQFDNQTNEKYIADIHTNYGLVIEFQHSHIDPTERRQREKFYQNMVWVVDGTRLKRDYPRFLKEKENFYHVRAGIFRVDFVEECFPKSWIGTSVPVIFDFYGNEFSNNVEEKNNLYCLFPRKIGCYTILTQLPRKAFIKTVITGEWLLRANNFMNVIDQVNKEQQAQVEKLQRIQTNINFASFPRIRKRRRRF